MRPKAVAQIPVLDLGDNVNEFARKLRSRAVTNHQPPATSHQSQVAPIVRRARA